MISLHFHCLKRGSTVSRARNSFILGSLTHSKSTGLLTTSVFRAIPFDEILHGTQFRRVFESRCASHLVAECESCGDAETCGELSSLVTLPFTISFLSCSSRHEISVRFLHKLENGTRSTTAWLLHFSSSNRGHIECICRCSSHLCTAHGLQFVGSFSSDFKSR